MLIVWPGSPLNEPDVEDDDDEDDYSEKNDDYDFDNQSTGTAQRHR